MIDVDIFKKLLSKKSGCLEGLVSNWYPAGLDYGLKGTS